MIVEAATTFTLIIDAAVMWVQILAAAAAFVLCVVAFAVGPLVVPAARTVRRRTPQWARGPIRARVTARRRTRPLWSHSQPLDYEEAA